ncbi:MFS transporter [Tenacibaculum tangerinum]|uniref:MFS transporter n=1 Tax=Tenacibaculum tangerinum TaxID=3038772 RepID=A0ABY8L105_9FLAO|nr:MFS transporter [Tenacibaculum tangerinum]WGH75146.1 MFS transporter [Tenacibaculum tangerinum]
MDQQIKTLKIIHLSMVAGATIAYTALGDFKNLFNMVIDNSSLFYAFIPAIAYVVGNILYRNILKNVQNQTGSNEKFAIYQTASIGRWAIIESACFIILFLKPDFLLLGVILLIYLILLAPRKSQILEVLNIKN